MWFHETKKKSSFWHFWQKNESSNKLMRNSGTSITKNYRYFSTFEKLIFFFQLLIIKILNSKICYFWDLMCILVPKLRFGIFCEIKSGFNFLFMVVYLKPKVVSGNISAFCVFFCAKFHGLKLAVFWPKINISRVPTKISSMNHKTTNPISYFDS